MEVPPEYRGREQTLLKHLFLRHYLDRWGHKIASAARMRNLKIWYVDCFSGPWQSEEEGLRDTSIHIGLTALAEAARTWETKEGVRPELGAVFVEKDRRAFASLRQFVEGNEFGIDCHPLHGAFGDHVGAIEQIIGCDPAFVFVDPTGWDGAAMRFIAPLVRHQKRDVLINVMFHHINRFKDDPRAFLRRQMKDFFGLAARLSPNQSEEQLMELYRSNLKRHGALRWAADAAVPHPTREQTKFRLVLGSRSAKALEVFREAEAKVLAEAAAVVRTAAAQNLDSNLPLFAAAHVAPERDSWYTRQREVAAGEVVPRIKEELGKSTKPWSALWPALLESFHLTSSEVAQIALEAARDGRLKVKPAPGSRRRRLRDEDQVSVG